MIGKANVLICRVLLLLKAVAVTSLVSHQSCQSVSLLSTTAVEKTCCDATKTGKC